MLSLLPKKVSELRSRICVEASQLAFRLRDMRKKIQTPALGPLIAQEHKANALDKHLKLDCDQILSVTRGGPVLRGNHGLLKACAFMAISLIILRTCALAQTTPAQQSSNALKKLSIDELMDIEVT